MSADEWMRRLSDLCGGGSRPSIKEIAQLAKADGIGPTDFSQGVRMLSPGLRRGGQDDAELRGLVASLAGSAAAIMEVAEDQAIHGFVAGPGGSKLVYVTRSVEFGEAVEVVAGGGLIECRPPGAIGGDGTYDLIVVRPPVNWRPPEATGADGFGSELIPIVPERLAPDGRMLWIGTVGLTHRSRVVEMLADIGLSIEAVLDLGPGWCAGSAIEGVVLVFRQAVPDRRLVGTLGEKGAAAEIANALINGPTRREGRYCVWRDRIDQSTWRDIQRRAVAGRLMPKGRHRRSKIRDLLSSHEWSKADRPLPVEMDGGTYIFVPEYVASRVTATLEDQTVAAKAVYRFAVDPEQASAAFVAHVLNTPFGRSLRQQVSEGLTIPRIRPTLLLDQEIPCPERAVQDRIVGMSGDIEVLKSMMDDRRRMLDGDWRGLDGLSDEIANMKKVVDADRRVEDWWQDLPYPLAVIYRRYRVSFDPLDRLEAGLHFFEVFAVYLAAIGYAHVRALLPDADEVLGRLAYPERASGIDRAVFGFWIGLAQGCAKALKRTFGDGASRKAATDRAGRALVLAAEPLQAIGDAAAVLHRPCDIRNSWKGHGGHIKDSDAQHLDVEIRQAVAALYAASASMLRRFRLVRIGTCEHGETASVYEAEILQGSDPTFEQANIEVDFDRRLKARTLAFWHVEQGDVVADVPFFQLGAPRNPTERTVYVYNRIEGEGLRWVSYQEARDQIILTDASPMKGIIRPRL